MTLLAEFEEVQLKKYIESSGLTTGFVDYAGNAQPALKSQVGEYDQSTMSDSDRYIVYLTAFGAGANQSLQNERVMRIALFSKVTTGSAQKLESFTMLGLRKQLEDWITKNKSYNDCISSVTVTAVNGPMNAGQRKVYEIALNVSFGV